MKSTLRNVLQDIIEGMSFSSEGGSLVESLFDACATRGGLHFPTTIEGEKKARQNMLRAIDGLLLESQALFLFLQKIHLSIDPSIREEFKDRRKDRRKPIEDFINTL